MNQEKWAQFVAKVCSQSDPSGPEDAPPPKNVFVQSQSDVNPPLHALIIGIDKYAIKPLAGAVNDAKDFKKFLTDNLVPEDNITTLFNGDATRDEIIKALQGLAAEDNKITPGDAIVIYYSGHGSQMRSPPDRADNGAVVQCIIPQDALPKTANGPCAIPDFTIGALLDDLAKAKGDNITVIFDCCHSASGTRDDDEPDSLRFIEEDDLSPLPAGIDSKIPGTSRALDLTDSASQAMSSHVFLAACGKDEVARENWFGQAPRVKRGWFTYYLMEILRRVEISGLTYQGCRDRFPSLARGLQNPVFEGQHLSRIFFNAKVPGADSSFILIEPEKQSEDQSNVNGTTEKKPAQNQTAASQKYYLQAGIAQGITPGDVFAVHDKHILGAQNKPLGTLIVDQVEPFTALLRLPDDQAPFPMPEPVYGRQVGYGGKQTLDVYFTDEFMDAAEPHEAWRIAFSGGPDRLVLRPVDEPLAQLAVGLSEDQQEATFKILNETAVKYGISTTLTQRVTNDPSNVVSVLQAAARWNWQLRREPNEHPLRSGIEVEYFKLKKQGDPKHPVWTPADDENLNIKGVVDVVASNTQLYGLKLVNNTEYNLFAYPFFFSFNDQSITPAYTRTAGNAKADPPLPNGNIPVGATTKQNFLTIGYGAGGFGRLGHSLNDGQDLDFGVYKIFLTTQPTSFSSLEQSSPFEADKGFFTNQDVETEEPKWDVVYMTVVQRRHPKPSESAGTTETQ